MAGTMAEKCMSERPLAKFYKGHLKKYSKLAENKKAPIIINAKTFVIVILRSLG